MSVPTPEPRPARDEFPTLRGRLGVLRRTGVRPDIADEYQQALDTIDRLRARVTELEALVARGRSIVLDCEDDPHLTAPHVREWLRETAGGDQWGRCGSLVG